LNESVKKQENDKKTLVKKSSLPYIPQKRTSLNPPVSVEAKKRLSLVGSGGSTEKVVTKRLSLGREETPPNKKMSRTTQQTTQQTTPQRNISKSSVRITRTPPTKKNSDQNKKKISLGGKVHMISKSSEIPIPVIDDDDTQKSETVLEILLKRTERFIEICNYNYKN